MAGPTTDRLARPAPIVRPRINRRFGSTAAATSRRSVAVDHPRHLAVPQPEMTPVEIERVDRRIQRHTAVRLFDPPGRLHAIRQTENKVVSAPAWARQNSPLGRVRSADDSKLVSGQGSGHCRLCCCIDEPIDPRRSPSLSPPPVDQARPRRRDLPRHNARPAPGRLSSAHQCSGRGFNEFEHR